MAVLLNVTSTPQSFAAGTFNAVAAAFNNGVTRFTITPTAASTTYTGGNFHILYAQEHGGLWLNDANFELYDTPTDNLAFSLPLTWAAGQPITVKLDTRSGSRSVTVSGALTGNGTFAFGTAGPYVTTSEVLDVGRFTGGGPSFDFLGTASSVDDGITTDGVSPAGIAIAGGTVAARRGLVASVAAASIAIVGGSINEGTNNQSDGASPASIAISGGTVSTRRTYADVSTPTSVLVVGSNVLESLGGIISLGPTGLDFQKFGRADRPSNVTMNTPVSGAVVVLCAGGKSADVSTSWTDSKNAAAPVTVGALVEYPDFPGYGTIVAVTPAPMTGGTAQAFTQPVTTDDENTTFALTAIVAGGHPRITEVHNNVPNATGTTQQTSPSISIDGEALLVAYWWGASPVVPPFTGGVGTPYTAVPNGGFTVVQSYLVNNEFGEVQAAMACLYVPAGTGPGTRNVTWTHSPAQGAQLRLVAIQPALADPAVPASITLIGLPIGERTVLREQVSAATLALVGGAVAEGTLRMDAITPAAVSVAGGSISVRRVVVASVSPAGITIAGGNVGDQISSNQRDSVQPATLSILSGVIPTAASRRVAVQSGAVSVSGAQVAEHAERKDLIVAAVVVILGATVQDQVATGIRDFLAPAALAVAGTAIQVRVSYRTPIVPALVLLHGSEVQARVLGGATSMVPPIPPGRAPARLEGRVVVPSIESRAAEQGHLFGVVRKGKDV